MKRIKKHRIKSEVTEATSSNLRTQGEHDLAYYIHDRVELMHQVFSSIKPKDLKAMTPDCIRHLSLDNIKELCTEELLGISSKRLCAVLDGAEPPSDTESSSMSASPEHLETISLDSISSDEELLSQGSGRKNKKHKHRHRDSKARSKKKKARASVDDEAGDKSKASRAGLTVLELLELQARARAIRAQLQKEQAAKKPTEIAESSQQSSDDEVQLKEEPAEVVEISSEDEKPNIEELTRISSKDSEKTDDAPQKVTKKISNLVITVPQPKQAKKIKLNRNKPTSVPRSVEMCSTSVENTTTIAEKSDKSKTVDKPVDVAKDSDTSKTGKDAKSKKKHKKKDKIEKKKEKSDKKKGDAEKEGSDHDEITLQLSDSEKLDLLEDLDRKNLDRVSSSSSDSESSSSDSEHEKDKLNVSERTVHENVIDSNQFVIEESTDTGAIIVDEQKENENDSDTNKNENAENIENNTNKNTTDVNIESNSDLATEITETSESGNMENEVAVKESDESAKKMDESITENEFLETSIAEDKNQQVTEVIESEDQEIVASNEATEVTRTDTADKNESDKVTHSRDSTESERKDTPDKGKEMSEGELSDRDSSEVEASEISQEVVCISDDDSKSKKKKKHKKKEKKNKKEKKSKKSKSDFREGCDQNFYIENGCTKNTDDQIILDDNSDSCKDGDSDAWLGDDTHKLNCIIIDKDDDILEILELSDDSSCYEIEGAVLSKEPTAEEIEALSFRIDEIKREAVITDEEICDYERREAEKNIEENILEISWKDRYLDSKKVKRILSTANIFNALRKKNKELKKKLEESKVREIEMKREKERQEELERLEKDKQKKKEIEGSVEYYNTLEGSTKYVDPIAEPNETEKSVEELKEGDPSLSNEGPITKEMKKDAKQLLKMYKRLLKYNDMTRKKEKDPNKKKKKKQKKKDKSDTIPSVPINEITNSA